MDETYKRTLLGIRDAKREYARRLFQCLAVSLRPLRVEELAEILAVRLDDGEASEYDSDWRPDDARQAVLSACSSLITILNVDGSPVVQFSHFSVKEFLMSSRLASAEVHLSLYHILPHSAHAVFSRACLSVLLNLGHPVDKGTVEKCPMAAYAARYWVEHAKFESVSSQIQDLVNRLFDPHGPYFATWVWIYDVDHPWKESMSTVHPTPPEAKSLYYAALCGFRNSVDILTHTYPTDVNAQGGSFGTALNAAFDKGEVDIALALLQRGADINALDIFGESSLYRAARDGNRALVKLLLEHQADVNVRTGNGRLITPLHFAAQVGELDICRLLLEHGADLASRNSDGFVPLHVASGRGHLDIVEEFLSRGADPNAQDVRLWTPLHWASSGPLEVAQSLVRHGAELDKTTVVQETPLHVASRLGSLKIARFLIENGANPMNKDNAGETPLHNASRHGHLGLVEVLLEVGVDVGAQNAEEETPLHITSGRGNLEVSRFLIKRGADVNCCDNQGWTPLHAAARNGHLDIVRHLLNHAVDIQVPNAFHETPLFLASIGGHVEVSRFLMEHQADVNSVRDGGWTSLHFASQHGHAGIVQLLLDYGADLKVQNVDLSAPLHLASAYGHLKVAEMLIDRGADIDVRNERQETPLDLASGNGELDVARLLVCSGSNVNSQDQQGWTPSHSAARSGHLGVVRLLVDSGADIEMRNDSGKTPLDLAHEFDKRDVVSFLEMLSGNTFALNVTNSNPRSQNSLPEFIKRDADPYNDEEIESLHSASRSGRLDEVRRLLDRGADVNELDELFQTPLDVRQGTPGTVNPNPNPEP